MTVINLSLRALNAVYLSLHTRRTLIEKLNNSVIPVSLGPQPRTKRSVDFGYDIDIVRDVVFDEAE